MWGNTTYSTCPEDRMGRVLQIPGLVTKDGPQLCLVWCWLLNPWSVLKHHLQTLLLSFRVATILAPMAVKGLGVPLVANATGKGSHFPELKIAISVNYFFLDESNYIF